MTPPWPEPWRYTPHYVYEFYDRGGTCLYVGCTDNPARRFKQHRYKEWWSEVADARVFRRETLASGIALERRKILDLNPLYNVRRPTVFTEAEVERLRVKMVAA